MGAVVEVRYGWMGFECLVRLINCEGGGKGLCAGVAVEHVLWKVR